MAAAEAAKNTVEQFTAASNVAFKEGVEKSLAAMNELNAHSKKNLEAIVASATASAKGAEALGAQAMAFSKAVFDTNVSAAKSLAAAPFADILWMETKTADLHEAKKFADAIHAKFPGKMLAYNLSPSFNWDTTGMNDDEMRRFPEELGKMGFVFDFITYGGHQIDGLAAEEFATALKQDGMLALARLQRKFRLLESPYRTPQTLVGGPRADAGLSSISGRTATTKAMGKGSTQFQHLARSRFCRAEGVTRCFRHGCCSAGRRFPDCVHDVCCGHA